MKLILNNKIQNLLLAGATATLLTACGGGSARSYNSTNTANGDTIELGIDNPICQDGSATFEGKVTDSQTKKAINNVNISIDGCTTKTDENGYYKLSNILSKGRTPVAFRKDGYYPNSEIIDHNNNTSNYLEFSFDAYESSEEISFDSEDGISKNNIEVSDTSKYTNIETGKKYSGNIKSNFFYKNTFDSNNKNFLPGNYQGINADGVVATFVTYGFMVIEFKDTENNNLNISETITFSVDNIQGTQDETISLWYYNYNRGMWIEKGLAYRDDKGNYVCEIDQAGTWSLSAPIETEMALYRGYIIDENNNPITNVRINAIGENWITKDLSTNENGLFEIYVVPEKSFKISAYNYKDKYGANYENTISPIPIGQVIEE